MDGNIIFQKPTRIAIAGASGGIGGALTKLCQERDEVETIYALARKPMEGHKIEYHRLDYDDIDTFEALSAIDSIDVLVIATGTLTTSASGPEKRIEQVGHDELQNLYRINAQGPILLAKALHHALVRKEPTVCLALSARVGSISDNHLGGWYSYRASKAALNMLFRSYSIEAGRSSELMVSLYHPGTVGTDGFKAYQKNIEPSHIKEPKEVAEDILNRVLTMQQALSGQLIDYSGEVIPF